VRKPDEAPIGLRPTQWDNAKSFPPVRFPSCFIAQYIERPPNSALAYAPAAANSGPGSYFLHESDEAIGTRQLEARLPLFSRSHDASSRHSIFPIARCMLPLVTTSKCQLIHSFGIAGLLAWVTS
jgi:hypothetical protein